ncbi:hypothetical protein PMIN01_11455 [Paraphaeosphaeria minitans]|uniref:Uncharacterized protein n=1 Tax=Paraphaeosphaeria minitans TaxID=565426 RepID=A0A9P6KLF0_9PLEO|nr:hypothetical protein PMIN01_11455 [Paraphaeosphaeria minitans]
MGGLFLCENFTTREAIPEVTDEFRARCERGKTWRKTSDRLLQATNSRDLWLLVETLSDSSVWVRQGKDACQLRTSALEAETDSESGVEGTQNTMRRRQYRGGYEEALVWTLSRLLPERGEFEKTLL